MMFKILHIPTGLYVTHTRGSVNNQIFYYLSPNPAIFDGFSIEEKYTDIYAIDAVDVISTVQYFQPAYKNEFEIIRINHEQIQDTLSN